MNKQTNNNKGETMLNKKDELLLKKLKKVMDKFGVNYGYDWENNCDSNANQIVYDIKEKCSKISSLWIRENK